MENEIRSHRFDKNRPGLTHADKCTKYKNFLSMMMLIFIKQQLINIVRSIFEKDKKHWGLLLLINLQLLPTTTSTKKITTIMAHS